MLISFQCIVTFVVPTVVYWFELTVPCWYFINGYHTRESFGWNRLLATLNIAFCFQATFMFFICNILWIVATFFLQIIGTLLTIRVPKIYANSTSAANSFIYIDPIGFMFLISCGGLFFIQFLAMLWHRYVNTTLSGFRYLIYLVSNIQYEYYMYIWIEKHVLMSIRSDRDIYRQTKDHNIFVKPLLKLRD